MPSGSCICGAVTYEYDADPAMTALCHCTDCQKTSGGGGTANAAVPTEALRVTGTPAEYTRASITGHAHHTFFCATCGAALFARLDRMPDTTFVKTGTLDGPAGNIPIQVEFFTRDRRSYTTPVPGAAQKTTMT